MTFTKGPWEKVYEESRGQLVTDGGGAVVAVVGGWELSETIANARLIAAAPELLDALKELKKLLRPDSGYHISPDEGSEGLGELMRIGAIFERASKAIANAEPAPNNTKE